MENTKVGFITPNNQKILMDYSKVENFCKEICLKEEYQAKFNEFSKKYTYFKPYFDFIMINLEYVFINPLLEEGVYLKGVGTSFYKVEETDLIDSYGMVTYETIANMAAQYQNTRYSHIVACSDLELHIKSANVDDEYSIMLDPNGYSMITQKDEKEGNHEITANTVVNQLLINNQYLVDNYNSTMYTVSYLIEKFGFVRATSLKHGGLMIGIERFLTEPQKKYCDICMKKGGFFHEMEIDEMDKEKEDYRIRRG